MPVSRKTPATRAEKLPAAAPAPVQQNPSTAAATKTTAKTAAKASTKIVPEADEKLAEKPATKTKTKSTKIESAEQTTPTTKSAAKPTTKSSAKSATKSSAPTAPAKAPAIPAVFKNAQAAAPDERTLTKAELVDVLFEKLSMSKRDAKQVVEAFFKIISQRLVAGEDVKISGLGNFQLRNKAPRPGRNPRTGELVPIEARRVVTFHTSTKLKDQIQASEQD